MFRIWGRPNSRVTNRHLEGNSLNSGKFDRPSGDTHMSLNKHKLELIRVEAADELGRAGPQAQDAVEVLDKSLHDKAVRIRMAAAEALGRINPVSESAIKGLIQALQDEDVGPRMAAVQALRRIGPRAHAAIPFVRQALSDPDVGVRWWAEDALAALSRP
jgi:HEAT repeat protein